LTSQSTWPVGQLAHFYLLPASRASAKSAISQDAIGHCTPHHLNTNYKLSNRQKFVGEPLEISSKPREKNEKTKR